MRLTKAGQAWSSTEQAKWAEKWLTFLKPRKRSAGDTHDSSVRKAKKARTTPRLASLDWMLDINQALAVGRGVGLSSFAKPHEYDVEFPLLPPEDTDPPVLVFGAMDQESKQRSACCYMAHALRHEGPMDPAAQPQRTHNDVELCIARAGLRLVWHRRLAIVNCSYGPWNGGLYMRDMEDIGAELGVLLDADHPVLLKVWSRICCDQHC